MQLIKERSFQGLPGSGIITTEERHCFERDNAGEGAGRRRSHTKMAAESPGPVSQVPTVNHLEFRGKQIYI